MKPSNLSIEFEVFAGADVQEAIAELVTAADRLQITAIAKINGVTVMAEPGCDATELYGKWSDALGAGMSYPVVCGRPVAP